MTNTFASFNFPFLNDDMIKLPLFEYLHQATEDTTNMIVGMLEESWDKNNI